MESCYHVVSLSLGSLEWLLRWATLTLFSAIIMWAVNAEVVLKATNVDGVYDADPRHDPNARLLETLSYHEVTTRDLSVMDMTAITLCQENNIPSTDAISLTLYWFFFHFFNLILSFCSCCVQLAKDWKHCESYCWWEGWYLHRMHWKSGTKWKRTGWRKKFG